MHVHPSADSRRCIVPGFLNLCLVELVLSADPARAVYVQSPMHGVHTWPKVLVWTPETLRASQSERDTSVPCCLYLSEDSNALAYISPGSTIKSGEARGGQEFGMHWSFQTFQQSRGARFSMHWSRQTFQQSRAERAAGGGGAGGMESGMARFKRHRSAAWGAGL